MILLFIIDIDIPEQGGELHDHLGLGVQRRRHPLQTRPQDGRQDQRLCHLSGYVVVHFLVDTNRVTHQVADFDSGCFTILFGQ